MIEHFVLEIDTSVHPICKQSSYILDRVRDLTTNK